MGDAVRKMVPRAPRYILGPGDNQVVRFSFADTKGGNAALQTSMVNLSETGVAFLIDPVLAPELGETVKIEIPIPGADQIAWFAQVVRIEMYEPRQWWFFKPDQTQQQDRARVLVGLRFEELPFGHQKAIRKGLEKSFLEALRAERQRKLQYWKHFLFINGPKILLWTAAFAAAVAILVLMEKYNIRAERPYR